MKIVAAVAWEKDAPLRLETLDLEAPRADEILVRVSATGICHTDLAVRSGLLPTPLPVVLGHEGLGVVEAVGSAVTKVAPGDHVVMSFNFCGKCPSCLDHAPAYCYEFSQRNFFATRADGTTALSKDGVIIHSNFFGQSSFASYALCREVNVVKVPKSAPLELLGPLGCGLQTGAGAVMNALNVTAGKTFVVFGAGSVGIAAVMAAKVVGASSIIVVDKNDDRLATARSLGATHSFNSSVHDPVKEIFAVTTFGANFSLDTTGVPAVIRTAVESLAPRGVCGLLGASGPHSELVLNETHFMIGGRRLIGIVEGESDPDVFIPKLIGLHGEGRFPFETLVKFYEPDQINGAIDDSLSGATIKPIVRFRDSNHR